MILNLGSLSFNADLLGGGGTPAWGTELGQGEGYKFSFEDMSDFFTGMVYSSVANIEDVTCPLGKGGKQQNDYDFVIASLFDKVYVNGKKVADAKFVLLVVKKLVGDHHVGRRTLKYNPNMTYCGEKINEDCYTKMAHTLGLSDDAAWFVHEINILNQNELHFTAYILGDESITYDSTEQRRTAYIDALPKTGDKPAYHAQEIDQPLQQIYYGAPGTGKSFAIDELTKGQPKDNIFRTTFHPDTDYSSFVGCYKPCKNEDGEITYDFRAQAFVDAYVQAYMKPTEPVFLLIEEINRGNCAQIFGDIFQLLDRDDETGFSKYSITPDKDLQDYLAENLSSRMYLDKDIKCGKTMRLPNNLYIWATMNTSDQSLFPIDSAFKRRWDWVYVPIDTRKEAWTIAVNGQSYSWNSFLEKINDLIWSTTTSEDKKLGFYFCKARDGVISADKFVSKVLFYLYNDVFKTYGFDNAECFKRNDKNIEFHEFYLGFKNVNETIVSELLDKLGVELSSAEDDKADIDPESRDRKEVLLSVTLNGNKMMAEGQNRFGLYMNVLNEIGYDRAGVEIEKFKYRRLGCPLASRDQKEAILADPTYRYEKGGDYYFVRGAKCYTLIRILEDLRDALHLDLQLEYK